MDIWRYLKSEKLAGKKLFRVLIFSFLTFLAFAAVNTKAFIFGNARETVEVYSLEVNGDWENEFQAVMLPDVGEEEGSEHFSGSNSAIYEGGPREIILSDFSVTGDELESLTEDEEIISDLQQQASWEGYEFHESILEQETGAPQPDLDLLEAGSGEEIIQEPEGTPEEIKKETSSDAEQGEPGNFLEIASIEETAYYLNVRDQASLEGSVVEKVKPGEIYQYEEEKDGWYKIKIDEETSGWVFGEYVILKNSPEGQAETEKTEENQEAAPEGNEPAADSGGSITKQDEKSPSLLEKFTQLFRGSKARAREKVSFGDLIGKEFTSSKIKMSFAISEVQEEVLPGEEYQEEPQIDDSYEESDNIPSEEPESEPPPSTEPENESAPNESTIGFIVEKIKGLLRTSEANAEEENIGEEDEAENSNALFDTDIDAKIIIWYSLDGDSPAGEWEKLDTITQSSTSNLQNGGYFSFDAPFLKNWQDLKNLRVKLEGAVGGETTFTAYLDSVWAEVEYEDTEKKDPQMHLPKKDWQKSEQPQLEITNLAKKSILERTWEGATSVFTEDSAAPEIKVKLTNPAGGEIELEKDKDFTAVEDKDPVEITILPNEELPPGKYSVEVSVSDGDEGHFFEDEFTWGVLAINTNKSIYAPGEKGRLAMAVLDERGNMVCDVKLELIIKNLELGINDLLSTENGKIKVNKEICNLHGFTLEPDYEAEYQWGEEGAYELTLTAETVNGTRTISDSVEVKTGVPFDVERVTATRIYPPADYPVTLKITANQDFEGKIVETVLDSFEILNSKSETLNKFEIQNSNNQNEKLLVWEVDVKKGDKLELEYEFNAPDVSPESYLLGPLKFVDETLGISFLDQVIFQEARQWQIAADAPSSDAMMVYDTQTITSTPKYRQWNGSSWDGESSANAVSGEIKYAELKFSPVADMAILVTQGSNGVISAQTWTGGATNSWGSVTTIGTVGGGTIEAASIDNAELYRSFDIEFEQTSGDAIIVYGDGTADPDFKTYTGGAWSGSGTNIDLATTSSVHWIELASSPGTDRLALITLDAAADIYGMRWDGGTWDDMNAGGVEPVWDATAATATRKCIDVAFETTSGDIIFMWADATQDQQIYREYSQSGGTLTAVTTVTIANQAGLGNWVRLAADPTTNSNRIMYAVQDASLDLFSAYWSGTAWTITATAHDTSLENVMSMQFDLVWETHSSNPNEGFLIWGEGAAVSSRHWTNADPPAWDAIDTDPTADDDTAVIRLTAQPNSGALLAVVYEDSTSATDNIEETHITGGGVDFTAQAEIWAGPIVTNTAGVAADMGFRVSVAPEKYSSSSDAMMVYDTQTITSTPKYRQWTGSWNGEASANAVSGEIKYMELKFSPVADMAILVTQGSNGVISAQTWTGGATNSWGSVTTIGTVGGGTIEAASIDNAELYRSFDIEFEQTSGDAVIVYGDGTADPDFKTYTGGSWSGSGTNIDLATTGAVHWIGLASSPGTDRLALITLDANVDIYGMRWDGGTWDDMNGGGVEPVWDATAATAARKCIDVAFETTSGDIIFMWADGTQDQQIYREYSQSGGTLTAVTTVTIANQAGLGNWVRLAADPTTNSNRIMYAVQDASLDLFSAYWSGTAWTVTATAHDTSLENVMSMQFDLVWETHSSNPNEGFLIWGEGDTVSSRHWTNADPPVWDAIDTDPTADDDTAVIRLTAQPNSGALLAAVYEDSTSATDNIEETHITGGGVDFTAQAEIWAGPIVTNTAAVASDMGFRVAIASEIYYSVSITVSGTVWTDEGKTTPITDGRTVHLFVNTTDYSTTTTLSGAYSFSGVTVAAGDSVIVYLDGVDEDGSAVTLALDDATAIGNLDIITGHISLEHRSAGPITNTDLEDIDDSDAGDEDGITVDAGNATFADNFELYILSGENYTPGGTVTCDDFELEGAGSFVPNANLVTVSGDWEFSSSGTFTTSGTVTFDGASAQTIISGGLSFNNVTFNNGSASDPNINYTGALTIGGNTTLSNATRIASTNNTGITFSGTINGANVLSINSGSGTVTFGGVIGGSTPITSLTSSGSGTVAINTTGITTRDVASNNVSFTGPVTLGAGLTVTTNNTTNDGTITLSSTINGANTLTLDNGGGTVTFGGVIGGSTPITSLTVSGSGTTAINTTGITTRDVASNNVSFAGPVTLGAGLTVTTNNTTNDGTITFSSTINSSDATDQALSLAAGSADISISGAIGATNDLASLTIAGNDITLANIGGGSAGVTGATSITGDTNGTITLTGTTYNTAGTQAYNAGGATRTITLNDNTTFTTTDDTITFTGLVNSQAAENNAITLTAGTAQVTFNNNVGATQSVGLLTKQGSGDLLFGSANLTCTGLTLSAGTINTAGTDSGTWTVSGNVTISSGTLKSTTGTLYVSGNWSNSASFVHSSGTVNLNGVNQSLTGNTTFYNLTKQENTNNSTDSILTIVQSSTQTVGGTLDFDGLDDSDRLNLVSSNPGTRYTFDFTGSAQSATWLDVSDANASSNNIDCTSNCVDGTNNDDEEDPPHWIFALPGITVSGGCFTDATEGTPCSDDGNNEIKVAINGALDSGTDTTVDGSWSFTTSSVPNSGDILVFFINGEDTESEEATTAVKYDGSGDVDYVKMYQSMLVIGTDSGSANSDQTIAVADMDTDGNGYENSDDEDVIYDVTAGDDLVVDASGNKTETLYVISGDTYRPASGGGGDTTAHHLYFEGTLTADNNAINVAGDFTNAGTFTSASSSTITFNGSAAQAFTTNSAAYGNITLNNTGSDGANDNVTISGALNVDGTFNITNGDLVLNSGNPNVNTAGDVTIGADAFVTAGSGTWTFDGGSGTHTFQDSSTPGGPQNLGAVVINNGATGNVVSTSSNMKVTTLNITADDTLNISGDILTISGSGTPFTKGGTFTVTGSTVVYTGTSATNITTAAYNNLTLTPASGSVTYSLAGDLTITNAMSGNLTISSGATLDTTGSSYDITLAGSWSNSGTFTRNSSVVTFNGTTSGLTISDGGSPFYDIAFSGSGGEWLYTNGADGINQTSVTAGTATYLNTKRGTTISVTGGTLNIDWYLGVKVVDAITPATPVDTGPTDITISENSSPAVQTVWKWSGGGGGGWGSPLTSQTTGTDSGGIIPQPGTDGAIRIREYSKTAATTTYYKYNLYITWQTNYGEYDYFQGYGGNYITSTFSDAGSGVDKIIDDDWKRTNPSTQNTHTQALDDPPNEGTWYNGMLEAINFDIDSFSKDFGTITPGANHDPGKDVTNTLTVTTSASHGYVIYAREEQPLTCSNSAVCGTADIDDYGAPNNLPTTWSNGVFGFGYSTNDYALEAGEGDANRFSGPKFAGFVDTGFGDPVADRSGPTKTADGVNVVTYGIAAEGIQNAGPYQTSVYYVVVPIY